MHSNTLKTILITGATDGLGLAAAKQLSSMGHTVLIHGRSSEKLSKVYDELSVQPGRVETYQADFSDKLQVQALAQKVLNQHPQIDVLINNAGVLKAPNPITSDGLDIRFAVNTLAPFLLTQQLMPAFIDSSRVITLSSAAQTPVNLKALLGQIALGEMEAYAQSKLAITMWSRHMSSVTLGRGPIFIALNPGSLLGSKMVKQGFGIQGKDISIGADIIVKCAVSSEFTNASGLYFDNDIGQFGQPHPDALNDALALQLVTTLNAMVNK